MKNSTRNIDGTPIFRSRFDKFIYSSMSLISIPVTILFVILIVLKVFDGLLDFWYLSTSKEITYLIKCLLAWLLAMFMYINIREYLVNKPSSEKSIINSFLVRRGISLYQPENTLATAALAIEHIVAKTFKPNEPIGLSEGIYFYSIMYYIIDRTGANFSDLQNLVASDFFHSGKTTSSEAHLRFLELSNADINILHSCLALFVELGDEKGLNTFRQNYERTKQTEHTTT